MPILPPSSNSGPRVWRSVRTQESAPCKPTPCKAIASEDGLPKTHDTAYALSGCNTRYGWAGDGLLSIKTFTGGAACYDAGGGRFLVDPHSFLILNHGRRYEITIDSAHPVTSFCLFFADGWAQDALRSRHASLETRLDNPAAAAGMPPIDFYERTYPHDDLLWPAVQRLRDALADRGAAPDDLWLETRLRDILGRLLIQQGQIRAEADAFPNAARASTRDELYRRVYRARDFLAAECTRSVTLSETAAAACLSPNHLLRAFGAQFGVTPHQFVIRRRLALARQRLTDTDQSVTRIALDIGFVNPGSLSRAFTRHFGVPPQRYRAEVTGHR